VDLQLHGKTSLGIEIAKRLNGEIISADSMQIYKDMNIGTAKAMPEEMQGINQYLVDIITPDQEYNVSKFTKDAECAIEDILSKGKTPIVVGGTGLYINSLVNGIEFANIEKDEEYEKELEKLEKEKGPDYLFKMLSDVDPESASVIEKNNIRRVIRALEIYKVTGKTKSELDRESIKGPKYDYKIFGIKWDRDTLYDRINIRVDEMINKGLVKEVENLAEKYVISKTAFQGLGYKEVMEYLIGKVSYEDMIEQIKLESRRYAKRQVTWFKKTENLKWIDGNSFDDMVNEIIEVYNN